MCAGAAQEGGDRAGGRETLLLTATGQDCTLQGQVGACSVQTVQVTDLSAPSRYPEVPGRDWVEAGAVFRQARQQAEKLLLTQV